MRGLLEHGYSCHSCSKFTCDAIRHDPPIKFSMIQNRGILTVKSPWPMSNTHPTGRSPWSRVAPGRCVRRGRRLGEAREGFSGSRPWGGPSCAVPQPLNSPDCWLWMIQKHHAMVSLWGVAAITWIRDTFVKLGSCSNMVLDYLCLCHAKNACKMQSVKNNQSPKKTIKTYSSYGA